MMRRPFPVALLGLSLLACRDTALARSAGEKRVAKAPVNDSSVAEQDTLGHGGAFVVRSVSDSGTSYKYQVFVPRGFDRTRRWPVVVFLAGSGAIGTDNQKQIAQELAAVIRTRRETFPAVAVFPQSPPGEHGVGRAIFARLVMSSLDQTMREFNGDTDRVYLTGYSYGASVGYELALKYRERWAAFVPIAGMLITPLRPPPATGRELPTEAELAPLRTLPVWVFHDRNDGSIPVASARRTVEVLRSLGAPVRYTEFPDADHGTVADLALATPELYTWLWAQRRRR